MPVELVIAIFENGPDKAAEYLHQYTSKMDPSIYGIIAASAVGRDENDKVTEKHYAPHQHDARWGTITGAAIGLLLGPAGLIAGGAIGAVTGAVLHHNRGAQIPNKLEKKIEKGIEPNSSTLIAYVDQRTEGKFAHALELLDGKVDHEVVPDLEPPDWDA